MANSSLPPSQSNSAIKDDLICHWDQDGQNISAIWKSEKNLPAPKKLKVVDDTLPADMAYRLMSEGTYLIWNGDFQNAKQLMQALARRIDKPSKSNKKSKANSTSKTVTNPSTIFHLHRQAQSHRARILGMLLIPMTSQYQIELRRSPDVHLACKEAWGESASSIITPLRELMGVISAHEWRKKGVEIAALGTPPNNRIYPFYGVFSPIRGEYIDLVAKTPLPTTPSQTKVAFDIGSGTGVLTAVLAKRGFDYIIGTDQSQRAIDCSIYNLKELNLLNLNHPKVEIIKTNLFPKGLASLIVCNPPWLPGRASSGIEQAIYDENSSMLLGFINGLAEHLEQHGEGWLILSDLAEHLGLRSRETLLEAIEKANLKVIQKIDTKPYHSKVQDKSDPLHFARNAEITSLWRLAKAKE